MREQTVFEHRKKHKNPNLDYILVYGLDTREQKIKAVGNVKFDDKHTIAEIIMMLANESKKHKEELDQQVEKVKELESKLETQQKLIEQIIQGKLELSV
jgi:altronate dehydratase